MTNISLKNFLKTYTPVSNDFIDEYYFFYDLCEKKKREGGGLNFREKVKVFCSVQKFS